MKKTGSIFPDTRLSLLMQLKSASDEAAWSEFVSIYQPVIYRMARKRQIQNADAQDLTQDVLVSVAKAIHSFEAGENSPPFRHWLRRVARNAILNVLTRIPKDAAVGGTGILSKLTLRSNNDDNIESELLFEYRRELYARAAAEVQQVVAADSWQVFQLAVVEKIPIEDVAKQLKKSVGAAYACRGRVMSRLRKAVEKMENDE